MSGRRRNRLAVVVFGLAGVVFLVVAFVQSSSDTDTSIVPDAGAAIAAAALISLALACAGPSWWVLFGAPGGRRAHLAAAFYSAQLGKYIPGGVWQAIGQIGLTAGAGIPTAAAAVALPVHVTTQVLAATTVGGFLTFVGSVPDLIRVIAGVGFLLVIFLHRGWMGALLGWLDARLDKGWGTHLPSQGAIMKSFGWGILTLVFSGSGMAMLLRSLSTVDGFAKVALAFSLAWVIGFLAIPVPSGLGVREGLLIAALASTSALVIAAAVAHRLITMVGEAVFIGGAHVVVRLRHGEEARR